MVMTPNATHAVDRARLLGSATVCATASAGLATGTWHDGFGGNQGAMKPSIGGFARHLATGTT